MKLKLFYILFAGITALQACGLKTDGGIPVPLNDHTGRMYFTSAHQLIAWNKKSTSLQHTTRIGDFDFATTYVTPQMLALRETKGDTANKEKFTEALMHYQDMLYFRLNISNPQFNGELLKYNLSNASEYSNRIKYCSFHLNKDVLLTNGNDTVPCAIHEFERAFNIQSGLNFMLAFPKIKMTNGVTLIYNDRLFNHGFIKFRFSKEIDHTPYLKIK